jgi:hypothetical protein
MRLLLVILVVCSSLALPAGLLPRAANAQSCRTPSTLSLFGGIIQSVSVRRIGRVYDFTFILNSRHVIFCGGQECIPCSSSCDGMKYLAWLSSSNICSAVFPGQSGVCPPQAGLQTARVEACDFNDVVLGFKVKFEEDTAVTGQFKPRKSSGQVRVNVAALCDGCEADITSSLVDVSSQDTTSDAE